jgi:hypothetical protein
MPKKIFPTDTQFSEITPAKEDHLLVADTSDGDKSKITTIDNIKPALVSPFIGTGLIYGGELSINSGDNTKFDVAAGKAQFVDSYTDPVNPVVSTITWEAQIGISVTNIAFQLATFVGVNVSGVFLQQATIFFSGQEREVVPLGVLTHPNLTNLSTASSFTNLARDTHLTTTDLIGILGARINQGGTTEYTPNGLNLKLNRSLSVMFGSGLGYGGSKKEPNYSVNTAETQVNLGLLYRPSQLSFSTDVPVTKYDPAGTGLVDIPEGWYVAHRIYYSPTTNFTFLQYGQFAYDSLTKASNSYDKEAFVKDNAILGLPLRTVLIVQKGITDLTDAPKRKFAQLGILGELTFNRMENYSRFAENIEVIDGMTYQQQAVSFVDSGGVLYVDIAAVFDFEATDISFVSTDKSINTIGEDFTSANLQVGDKIIVTGSTYNNCVFTVVTIATLKLTVSETIVDEAAGANVKIETPGKGDITFVFGEREYVLNCTSGSGIGGRARIALSHGTDVSANLNWVWVIPSNDVAVLQQAVSDNEPSGEVSILFSAYIPSVSTSIAKGFYNSRRWTDSKVIEGRGAVPTILSKLRDPIAYKSGGIANITIDTGPSPDSVDFTVTSSIFREIYLQTVCALQLSVNGAIVVNDSVTPYRYITDLNQITLDASGNSLNNKYFQVIVMVSLNIDGHIDRLLINLPTNSYGNAADAFNDVSGYSVTTLPFGFKSAYLLFAGVFKIQGGTQITNEALGFGLNNIPLLGQPLGATSGGSGAAAVSEFSHSLFRIYKEGDSTSKIAFSASAIPTATTRTITAPNRDLNLATPIFDSANVDNVSIDGRTVKPTDTNGDLKLLRDGSGQVILGDDLAITSYGTTNIVGTAGGISGPITAHYISTLLAHPIFQTYPIINNGIAQYFDMYNDGGAEKSSYSGSNFAVKKISNTLGLYYDSGITAGSSVTLNEGLKLDTSGNVIKPNQCFFNAYNATNRLNVTGDGTNYTVLYDVVRINRGGDYVGSVGVFTAPVPGVYYFTYSVIITGMTAAHTRMQLTLVTSNRTYQPMYSNPYAVRELVSGSAFYATSYSFFGVDMDAGDTSYIVLNVAGGTKVVDINGANNFNNFMGGLMH